MTQSREQSKTTMPNEKKLVRGVGYITIFCSNNTKLELSLGGDYLRRTKIDNGKEYLYTKVENREEVKEIEFLSERWILYEINSNSKYIVMKQCDASGKGTGYCKIIEKSKATINKRFFCDIIVRAESSSDWMYYKRRTDRL